MQKFNQRKDLQPSGLNSIFYGDNLEFEQYIQLMQEIILKGRIDLTSENKSQILEANSPFLIQPPSGHPPKQGVLLIHGLFDSPFYVRELGEYYASKGLLVKAIVLPGHGTVPGDLLHINYREWIKAVDYGIRSLLKDVNQIYLSGHSLGGVLALNAYFCKQLQPFIKGLILFAPALRPKSLIHSILVQYHSLFGWVSGKSKWYQIRPADNYVKYTSYALNAARQTCYLIKKVHRLLKPQSVKIPLFITTSNEDETVSPKAIYNFFENQPNSNNKIIIYTRRNLIAPDNRFIIKTSVYPDQKILDFSHSCLTISPQNNYLGANSHFLDLNHYPGADKSNSEEIFLGAANKENLKNYYLSRLSYNPDFDNLLKLIDEFFVQT